jgi:hypothetical protein
MSDNIISDNRKVAHNTKQLRARSLFRSLVKKVATPAINSFAAREGFSGLAMMVKTVSRAFDKLFMSKIESQPVPAEELEVKTLRGKTSVAKVIAGLGGVSKVEITLGQFAAIFAAQPNGERGALPTDGSDIVGFVRLDIGGELLPVFGWWDGGWSFGVYNADDILAHELKANTCIFARPAANLSLTAV